MAYIKKPKAEQKKRGRKPGKRDFQSLSIGQLNEKMKGLERMLIPIPSSFFRMLSTITTE